MKNLPGSPLKNLLTLGHTLSLTITIKSLITTTAVTAPKNKIIGVMSENNASARLFDILI